MTTLPSYSTGMMEPTTATFFDLVRDRMPRVEARMRQTPGEHHPELSTAIDHLLSSGGKRIRPTLVLLACNLLRAPEKRAVILAAAIEMLHTATLVHDDLIDGSMVRRGIPTLNAEWTPGATVLTGDYIFARAALLAAQTGSLAVMEAFARTLMTIVNGEITQLFRSESGDRRADYLARIYAKTASLFELAAEGSALLSRSEASTTESMRDFGYDVGIAFQIVDDVLDFVGEQEKVGKPVANDLRQGLITLPTLYYFESFPDDPTLGQLLAGRQPAEPEMDRLIDAIRTSGAIERSLEDAQRYAESARENLGRVPGGPERQALQDLANYVVERPL